LGIGKYRELGGRREDGRCPGNENFLATEG
jgi:hypothetical protein